MKVPPYFPHPTTFRHERGVKRAMKDFGGALAYGAIIYMTEVLATQPSLRYPLSDIDILSDEISVSVPILITIIEKYGIFEIDENHFFSFRLSEALQPYFSKIEQREVAGRISAKKKKIKTEKQIKELEMKLSQSDSIQRDDGDVTLSRIDSNQQREEKREKKRKETQLLENGSSSYRDLEKWLSEKSATAKNKFAYSETIRKKFLENEQSVVEEFENWKKSGEEFKHKEAEKEEKNKIEHADFSIFVRNPQNLEKHIRTEKKIKYVVDMGLSTLDITFEDLQTRNIFKKDLYPILKSLQEQEDAS